MKNLRIRKVLMKVRIYGYFSLSCRLSQHMHTKWARTAHFGVCNLGFVTQEARENASRHQPVKSTIYEAMYRKKYTFPP